MLCYTFLLSSFFLVLKKQRAESQDEENIEYQYMTWYALPWQRSFQHDSASIGHVNLPQYDEINPGEFVLRALFTEFTVLAERKIDRLLKESLVSCNTLGTNIQTTYHARVIVKSDHRNVR